LSVVHYSYRTYCVHLNEYRDGTVCKKEPGSSVSIVSGYGLEDRAIEVRSPTRAEDISSILCVQTSSGTHPASCTMSTGGPFPGGKARPGRDADHSQLYLLSPQAPPWQVARLLYFTACKLKTEIVSFHLILFSSSTKYPSLLDDEYLRSFASCLVGFEDGRKHWQNGHSVIMETFTWEATGQAILKGCIRCYYIFK
jgi:hypothetical protein